MGNHVLVFKALSTGSMILIAINCLNYTHIPDHNKLIINNDRVCIETSARSYAKRKCTVLHVTIQSIHIYYAQ